MTKPFTAAALTAALALSSAGLCFAADASPAASQPAASAAKASPKAASPKAASPSKGASAATAKAPASAKLVDINSASKKELKKLPGISDAQAAKIIAGRPYGSKAWLVTHDIIDGATYESIKKLIIAKQTQKDGASNAALDPKKP